MPKSAECARSNGRWRARAPQPTSIQYIYARDSAYTQHNPRGTRSPLCGTRTCVGAPRGCGACGWILRGEDDQQVRADACCRGELDDANEITTSSLGGEPDESEHGTNEYCRVSHRSVLLSPGVPARAGVGKPSKEALLI